MTELSRSTFDNITTGSPPPPPDPDPDDPPSGSIGVEWNNVDGKDNWDGALKDHTSAGWPNGLFGPGGFNKVHCFAHGGSKAEYQVPGVPLSSRFSLLTPGTKWKDAQGRVIIDAVVPSHSNPAHNQVLGIAHFGQGAPDHTLGNPAGADPEYINGNRCEGASYRADDGSVLSIAQASDEPWVYGIGIYVPSGLNLFDSSSLSRATVLQVHGTGTDKQPYFNATLDVGDRWRFQARIGGQNRKAYDPIKFVRDQWMLLLCEIKWHANAGFMRFWRSDNYGDFRRIALTGDSLEGFSTIGGTGKTGQFKAGFYGPDEMTGNLGYFKANEVFGRGLRRVAQALTGRTAVKA